MDLEKFAESRLVGINTGKNQISATVREGERISFFLFDDRCPRNHNHCGYKCHSNSAKPTQRTCEIMTNKEYRQVSWSVYTICYPRQ